MIQAETTLLAQQLHSLCLGLRQDRSVFRQRGRLATSEARLVCGEQSVARSAPRAASSFSEEKE
jgi:hypothetical protein